MKAFKWIWVSLMILCLLCPAFSLAEAGEPRFCLPEEVDLSQVQEIDGRLKGEILLPSREGDSGSYRLLVDCPVPQGFSAKQQVRLLYRDDRVRRAVPLLSQQEPVGRHRNRIDDLRLHG